MEGFKLSDKARTFVLRRPFGQMFPNALKMALDTENSTLLKGFTQTLERQLGFDNEQIKAYAKLVNPYLTDNQLRFLMGCVE
jgi:hypothetical protein